MNLVPQELKTNESQIYKNPGQMNLESTKAQNNNESQNLQQPKTNESRIYKSPERSLWI